MNSGRNQLTSTTGAAPTNSFKFTAREDDGTGLHYYRARYYQPALGRFLSEDPLDMVDGPNNYLYITDDPMNLTDVLGLTVACATISRTIIPLSPWFTSSVAVLDPGNWIFIGAGDQQTGGMPGGVPGAGTGGGLPLVYIVTCHYLRVQKLLLDQWRWIHYKELYRCTDSCNGKSWSGEGSAFGEQTRQVPTKNIDQQSTLHLQFLDPVPNCQNQQPGR
jgi:RHS repeat-associated protein